jgi:Type ISP C-terminal specificity domain/N-6 DNA Methylase
MNALLTYLKRLHDIKESGIATSERSYYPALDTLFNTIGANLSPKVLAIHDISDQGSGHPDYALQVDGTHDLRAVIEAKPTDVDVTVIMQSKQVRGYLAGYNLCLVVNLRDFALVQMGRNNQVKLIMRYPLTADERMFWRTSPENLAKLHNDGLADFLISVLTWDAPISRPKDLAEALARYAREALRRLEHQSAEALAPLRLALSKVLGLHFTDEVGEHFFRSSLVQTLFYGLFSAWVVWNRNSTIDDQFRWREAGDYLSLPIMRELFERIAIPSQLEMLDIRRPLEWAEATLRRTSWEKFSASFSGDAVNYFYEPFLEAFDPGLREQLGVWYTPREIIRYQVARVDQLLREELNIPTGLADERVIVLDPAVGTGGYLLEVLRVINTSLIESGMGAMRGIELRNAAIKRIFGFEILPAPFVVAHMQVATLLADQGIPLEAQQRVGIYLTNSLTGWDIEEVEQLAMPDFPALNNEAEAASKVKHEAKILVILGNPPYRGPAGVAEEEEHALLAPYYVGLNERFNIQARGINDLYVRFFRLAERQIAETTGRGIISYISNSSWLKGLSHPIMRERMLTTFNQIWIDNLNGGGLFRGSRGPDGKPDRSIFEYVGGHGSVGITLATAITCMVKTGGSFEHSEVWYRELWGQGHEKRQHLADDALLSTSKISARYQPLTPKEATRFILVPAGLEENYFLWPALDELFVHHYPGVKTSRDPDLISIDPQILRERMQHYFDSNLDDDEVAKYAPSLMRDTSGLDAKATRRVLLKDSRFREDHLIRVAYRPFDNRWLYWEGTTKLLDRNRMELFRQIFPGNLYLEAVRRQRKANRYDHGVVLSYFVDLNFVDGGARCFPLYERQPGAMFEATRSNFRDELLALLTEVYGDYPNLVEDLFYHITAILNTPKYREESAGYIEENWPRIPLPDDLELLQASAMLGQQVANLLRPEVIFKVPEKLRSLAIPTRSDGKQLTEADLQMTVRYGGIGKYEPRLDETGKMTGRLWWNNVAYWDNVPLNVWSFTIGGYPVVKKWLDYRHIGKLGRSLHSDEVRYLTEMVQRIAVLLALGSSLDTNYATIKVNTLAVRKAAITPNFSA